MDAQHKRLVAMINDLHDAMKDGHGKESLGRTLDGLIDYAGMHFADEEKLMAKVDFAELPAHKLEHEAFVKKALKLQADFRSGEVIMSFTVMEFLKDWLVNHILKVDKKYGACL
jgi:hemerythrin-like metal-binding protein